MTILYQDSHIVVCVKPVGVLSQEGAGAHMPGLLAQTLGVQTVYPIHRLDRAAGGVMVYALTRKAAALLSRAVQDGQLHKGYLAVLIGCPTQEEAVLEDLLFHDKNKNKTYLAKKPRKGVKPARLSYRLLAKTDTRSLVQVQLYTGRTHQIRVQFASRKLPLAGDGRYGGKAAGEHLGLWSVRLQFPHPVTGQPMTFSALPPVEKPWTDFDERVLQSGAV